MNTQQTISEFIFTCDKYFNIHTDLTEEIDLEKIKIILNDIDVMLLNIEIFKDDFDTITKAEYNKLYYVLNNILKMQDKYRNYIKDIVDKNCKHFYNIEL